MPRTTLAACAGALIFCTTLPAQAVGQRIDVQVVDRGTGETLTPIAFNGEWWVAGKPGARYGVTIVSRDARRTLNVISVDGVNAISGDTAAWNQTGYVLDAYQRTRIDGWRKSMSQVAAFVFTALPDAYAVRTGRPANVGVIGVATFGERRSMPILRRDVARAEADRASSSTPLPAPSAAPSGPATADTPPVALSKVERFGDVPALRERIGTGHGEIEASSIRHVSFQRAQETPDEIVTIHYDRIENLIAMGIVPPPVVPVTRRGSPDPFPDSGRFVADPPPR